MDTLWRELRSTRSPAVSFAAAIPERPFFARCARRPVKKLITAGSSMKS